MKKTRLYLIIFYFAVCSTVEAQKKYNTDDSFSSNDFIGNTQSQHLRPVYFNYSKRRLYYNINTPLSGRQFLETCRGINDSHIANQIRKYDQLTSNKKKLLAAMIVCGVGGYLGLISSTGMISTSGNYNQNGYAVMGISAASLFIATPILAISTGIPHQKRKQIVFRDLPEVYNFYVHSQPNY